MFTSVLTPQLCSQESISATWEELILENKWEVGQRKHRKDVQNPEETLQKDEQLSIKLGPTLITEASTQIQGIFKK